jgi:hypothetical protein
MSLTFSINKLSTDRRQAIYATLANAFHPALRVGAHCFRMLPVSSLHPACARLM